MNRQTKSGVQYGVFGEADQPTVVFVHGLAGDSGQLSNVAAQLPARYRIVLIDLPGHGASKCVGGVHTIERYSCVIREVLDAEGIERAVLVGHSAGAAVSVRAAVDRPRLVAEILALDSLAAPTLYTAHSMSAALRHQVNILVSHRSYLEKLLGGVTAMATTERWRADLVRQLMRTPRWVAASFARLLVTATNSWSSRIVGVPIRTIHSRRYCAVDGR